MLHISATDISFGITSAKSLTDGTTSQQDIGITRYVGTGVDRPAITLWNLITAVTTAEDITNLESTIDGHISKRYIGSIAATIDFVDTGIGATVDNDLCLLSKFNMMIF